MTEIDVRLFHLLHHALGGAWTMPMAVLSALGGGWAALAVLPLLAAARTRRFARVLGAVLVVTAIVVFVLKRCVGRIRPCACLEGVHALVWDTPTDFSFPSGHAAGTFAFAIFVAVVLVRTAPPGARAGRWVLALALGVFAVGVGLSRIALGVHFPGDVAAGALIGSIVAVGGARAYGDKKPSDRGPLLAV